MLEESGQGHLVARGYLGLFSFFFERDRSTLLAFLLTSIQQITSLTKFGHLAEKSGKGSISNLSTKVHSAPPPSAASSWPLRFDWPRSRLSLIERKDLAALEN